MEVEGHRSEREQGESCRQIDVRPLCNTSVRLANPTILFLFKSPLESSMAAATPRASGLWEHSDMAYSRLSAHDPSEDAEGSEVDSRTPLDKTIDQIGMGTNFLSS